MNNVLRWLVTIVISVIVGYLFSGILYNVVLPSPEIKIIDPKEGDQIPRVIDIKGTWSGFWGGLYLGGGGIVGKSIGPRVWIVMGSHSAPGKWWPQGYRIEPWNGTWTREAWIGVDNDTGKKFDIAVILLSRKDDQYFMDYRKILEGGQCWPGIELPPNENILYKITVIRE